MKCPKELIEKYIENELTDEEKTKLLAHLTTCKKCDREIKFWTNMNNIKKELNKIEVSPDLSQKIMSKLGNKPISAEPRNQSLIWNWKLIPVMAVVILTVIIPLILKGHKRVYVTFKLEANSAHTVSLVGDFNNWDLNAAKLKKGTGGVWEATIPVKPGKYQYTLIIDGKEWVLDPQDEKKFDCNMELYFISNPEENYVAATRG